MVHDSLVQHTRFQSGSTSGLVMCVAVCCGVLQCVAVCCSVLQCVAVCCSVLQSGSTSGLVTTGLMTDCGCNMKMIHRVRAIKI